MNQKSLTNKHNTSIFLGKILLFNKIKPGQIEQQGFSFLEIFVAILVLAGFLLGSLQATVFANLLRVQALDKQEAQNWGQQDLELIMYQAFILDNPTEATGLTPTQANACNNNQYGQRLEDFIDDTYPATANITIDNKSYSVTRTYTPSGNTLQITHAVAYASSHPRFSSGGDNTVASLSAEVIPNAVLSCS